MMTLTLLTNLKAIFRHNYHSITEKINLIRISLYVSFT